MTAEKLPYNQIHGQTSVQILASWVRNNHSVTIDNPIIPNYPYGWGQSIYQLIYGQCYSQYPNKMPALKVMQEYLRISRTNKIDHQADSRVDQTKIIQKPIWAID